MSKSAGTLIAENDLRRMSRWTEAAAKIGWEIKPRLVSGDLRSAQCTSNAGDCFAFEIPAAAMDELAARVLSHDQESATETSDDQQPATVTRLTGNS